MSRQITFCTTSALALVATVTVQIVTLAGSPASSASVSHIVASDGFPADTQTLACAKPVDLVRTETINANGSVVLSDSSASMGHRYIYNLDGTQVSETMPPADFDPLQASTTALRAYDFPPRPANPARHTAWAHLRPGAPGMCIGRSFNNGATSKSNVTSPATRGPNQTDQGWDGGISFSNTSNRFTTSETE